MVKYKFEDLVNIAKETLPNIELLEEYHKIVGKTKKRNERRIKCRCKIDGYIFERTVNEIVNGVGCRKCADKANADRTRLNVDIVVNNLKQLNPNVLVLSNEYINARTPLKCKCLIHNEIFYNRYDDLRKGKGCHLCKGDKLSKENNAMWKGGVTPLHNYLRDKITQWKKDSLKNANYRCDITGIKDSSLIIHHLHNFSDILKETLELLDLPIYDSVNKYTEKELDNITNKCIELHYKYGLGVCLCEKEHKLFHAIYGVVNNTKEQYEEFKKNRLKELGRAC